MSSPRIAFKMRIRADSIAEYIEAHRHVWPELLEVIKNAGISDYSIFRHNQDLFFCMRVSDFEQAWSAIEKSSVNSRWQQQMAPFFEIPSDLKPDERFPMMEEVFYLP